MLSFCEIAEQGQRLKGAMAQLMLDWNDLRYFLAVARKGSTLAAGRNLRVSQTTVARRVAALEEALGVRLFDKRQAGYAFTSRRSGSSRASRAG